MEGKCEACKRQRKTREHCRVVKKHDAPAAKRKKRSDDRDGMSAEEEASLELLRLVRDPEMREFFAWETSGLVLPEQKEMDELVRCPKGDAAKRFLDKARGALGSLDDAERACSSQQHPVASATEALAPSGVCPAGRRRSLSEDASRPSLASPAGRKTMPSSTSLLEAKRSSGESTIR